MSNTIEFELVRKLRDEYFNVYLDSQMNFSERVKWAGEIPRLLGNFERLHREVHAIAELLTKAFDQGCIGSCHQDGEQCYLIQALKMLDAIDEEWGK